jgi:hypothetical protein
MRTRFVACNGCGRHVREGDPTCPFCGAVAGPPPAAPRTTSTRLSRAAMLAAGAAGGVVVLVDCNGGGNVNNQGFYGLACTTDACGVATYDASTSGDGAVFADVQVVVEAGDAATSDAVADGPALDADEEGVEDGSPEGASPDAAADAGGD